MCSPDRSRVCVLLALNCLFLGLFTFHPQVYMDDLTDTDEAIGALKVAVLIPTCGEKTAVMLKALFGNLQLR